MADEIIPSVAPQVTTETTPVVETTAPAVVETTVKTETVPAAETTVLGAEPVEIKSEVEKVAEPEKVPEASKDEKPIEAETEVEKPKTEGDKPVEDKKIEDKKIEEKVPEQKLEETALPVYEALVLSEGTLLAPERVAEIDSMFGNFEKTTKADHAETGKFRQAMVEYGLGMIKDAQAALHDAYIAAWKEKRETWRKEFESDSEYGGNRKDTTVAAANEFIRTHGGTAEQQKELRSLLEETGLGNNKAIIRSFANANLARSEGKPLPAIAPPAPKMNKMQKMYGKKK